MLEFLIALLIFSTGMMGLLSAQLAGKRAGFEAAQRSVATLLARDILERMRANPRHTAGYQIVGVGDTSHRLPHPGADCTATACSAQELVAFDLWHWESLLVGAAEHVGDVATGGLIAPLACITEDNGEVGVTISWRGLTTTREAVNRVCSNAGAGADDEPGLEEGERFQRHQLTLSTFIRGG